MKAMEPLASKVVEIPFQAQSEMQRTGLLVVPRITSTGTIISQALLF